MHGYEQTERPPIIHLKVSSIERKRTRTIDRSQEKNHQGFTDAILSWPSNWFIGSDAEKNFTPVFRYQHPLLPIL